MQILIILFVLQIYTALVVSASLSPPPTDEWGDYNGLDLIDVRRQAILFVLFSLEWYMFCLITLYKRQLRMWVEMYVSNILCKSLNILL